MYYGLYNSSIMVLHMLCMRTQRTYVSRCFYAKHMLTYTLLCCTFLYENFMWVSHLLAYVHIVLFVIGWLQTGFTFIIGLQWGFYGSSLRLDISSRPSGWDRWLDRFLSELLLLPSFLPPCFLSAPLFTTTTTTTTSHYWRRWKERVWAICQFT